MKKNNAYEICHRFCVDNFYLFEKEINQAFSLISLGDEMESEDFYCFMLLAKEGIYKDEKKFCEILNESPALIFEYFSNKKRLQTLRIDKKLGKLVVDEGHLHTLLNVSIVSYIYSHRRNENEKINKLLDNLINRVLYMSDYDVTIQTDCVKVFERLIDKDTLIVVREYDKNIGFSNAENLISELNALKN